MNIRSILSAIFSFCVGVLQAQLAPPVEWHMCLGGSDFEVANATQQTSDGGYVLVGFTQSNNGNVSGNHGALDGWMVKLDASGALQWQLSLGGSGIDNLRSVHQTADGGYIAAGKSDSNDGDVSGNHGYGDVWLVKVSALGTLEWQRSLGGNNEDEAGQVRQTADGGYIIAAVTATVNNGDVTGYHANGDGWLVKVDDQGAIEWQRALGGSGPDGVWAVRQTADGGYIVAGDTESNNGDVSGNHGGYDAWVVKLDGLGTIQWQHAFGGSLWESGTSIEPTSDGGYVLSAWTYSVDGEVVGIHGNCDAWLVKMDQTGVIQWQAPLGGSARDEAGAVKELIGGGYVAVCWVTSNNGNVSGSHGGEDGWVVGLNATGTIEWQKPLGGSGNDRTYGIEQTTDGGFITSGYTWSNNGDATGNHGDEDFWVVKLGALTTGVNEQEVVRMIATPNPSSGTLTIVVGSAMNDASLDLFDGLGNAVLHARMTGSGITLDLSDQPRGMYLLTLRNDMGIAQQRIVLN